MSAATEELLEQILALEEKVSESKARGVDVSSLEDQLLQLKERFLLMNENLRNGKNVLKG